ncbi:MAG: hypothetical protein QW478_11270 [Candidatus Micrarchaeaceae archaeon]
MSENQEIVEKLRSLGDKILDKGWIDEDEYAKIIDNGYDYGWWTEFEGGNYITLVVHWSHEDNLYKATYYEIFRDDMT